MKKLAILLLLIPCFTLYSQVCPTNYSANVQSTVEVSNQANGSCGVSSINWGQAPYSYQWNSGETTASISNKSSGMYTVTVTDNNQCTQVVCTYIGRDTVPCETNYVLDYNNNVWDIYTKYQIIKQPNQTGILLELYDDQHNLIRKSYYSNLVFNNQRFEFRLGLDVYYNNDYKFIVKSVFGSDTANYCGDTINVTIDDFLCDLNFNRQHHTVNDTIPINSQFLTNNRLHMSKFYYHLYDVNWNHIRSFSANQAGNGSSWYIQFPSWLFYNETFHVTYSTVYHPGDSIIGCDTATFVVDDYYCDFGWHINSCQDTLQPSNHLYIGNYYHYGDVYVKLIDANGNVNTIKMSGNPGQTRYLSLAGHVTPGNHYQATSFVVYEHYDPAKNVSDTVQSCGDTCDFYVATSSNLVRHSNNSISSQLSPNSQSIVYPNPANDELNIDLSDLQIQKVHFTVFDIKGQMLLEKVSLDQKGAHQLNIEALKSGNYILRIDSPNYQKSWPFTVK